MFIYITISSLIIFLVALTIGLIAGGYIAKPLYVLRDKLNHSATMINDVSLDISSASDDLQTASNKQASAIEQTSASLEELVGTVAQNVSNSELAQNVSSGVEQISAEGNESMEKLVQSMKDILASNDRLKDLVNVIKEIGGKTEVIDEIVFQTKLLSFNASVEAERAGEHGRGFAVVAQEVGNLASMSGNAALEISTLVKDSINTAQVITSDNEGRVKGGSDMVEVVSEILQKIEKNSKQSAEYSSQIFSSSREQDLGIRGINEAILEVDKITQVTSEVADKTSTQSDTLKDKALDLDRIVHELSVAVTGEADKKK
jgi:methyl-accepting chemotaxis protein